MLVRKLFLKLKHLRKYLRGGGIVQVNIAQINRGEVRKGKTVLVTGGSSGIGWAIARKCLAEGVSVVITGRNIQKLKDVCGMIAESRLRPLLCDVDGKAVAHAMLRELVRLFILPRARAASHSWRGRGVPDFKCHGISLFELVGRVIRSY